MPVLAQIGLLYELFLLGIVPPRHPPHHTLPQRRIERSNIGRSLQNLHGCIPLLLRTLLPHPLQKLLRILLLAAFMIFSHGKYKQIIQYFIIPIHQFTNSSIPYLWAKFIFNYIKYKPCKTMITPAVNEKSINATSPNTSNLIIETFRMSWETQSQKVDSEGTKSMI